MAGLSWSRLHTNSSFPQLLAAGQHGAINLRFEALVADIVGGGMQDGKLPVRACPYARGRPAARSPTGRTSDVAPAEITPDRRMTDLDALSHSVQATLASDFGRVRMEESVQEELEAIVELDELEHPAAHA